METRVNVPSKSGTGEFAMEKSMTFRAWVFQDWAVNKGCSEQQVLLAWFRFAQWAHRHWGPFARMIVIPYESFSALFLAIELPVVLNVGPRLRLYHKAGIVINGDTIIGSDCKLRHGITIGNKVDRAGNSLGSATLGDDVDLGAGCVVIGDIHVGDHARIGANAVVTKPVPDYGIVVGNPGRVIRIDDPHAAHENHGA
jgi:putative colanic acid biosynthesis acetyltransferase WcaB